MMRVTATAILLLAALTANSAPKPAPEKLAQQEKASDPADKMICKRFVETGSLVKGYRTCKTKRDWEREREAIRSNTNSTNSCANMGQTGSC